MKKQFFYFLLIAASLSMTSCGYNNMVNLQEKVTMQWADVENVYQRRADLLPNLVKIVKANASHEKETLEGVIKARAEATKVTIKADQLTEENLARFEQAQQGLSGALSRLMMVSEQYPNLKANEGFRDLSAQVEGSENRITVERRKYNEVVQQYNSTIKKFPGAIYAGWFGFTAKPYFKAKEGADVVPDLDL
jgi:LemA protein